MEWATLIGRVADGDREAFRRLFEHFAPRVKGLMLKTGAGSDDAEEIAQETLLAVWRKAAQFDPVSAGASGLDLHDRPKPADRPGAASGTHGRRRP